MHFYCNRKFKFYYHKLGCSGSNPLMVKCSGSLKYWLVHLTKFSHSNQSYDEWRLCGLKLNIPEDAVRQWSFNWWAWLTHRLNLYKRTKSDFLWISLAKAAFRVSRSGKVIRALFFMPLLIISRMLLFDARLQKCHFLMLLVKILCDTQVPNIFLKNWLTQPLANIQMENLGRNLRRTWMGVW